MTVQELKNSLKGYKNSDIVYLVKNWSSCNENGELTELAEITSVNSQRIVVDMGLEFIDQHQVLLEAEGIDNI